VSEPPRRAFADAHFHDDVSRAQHVKPSAGNFGIRILRGRNHPRYARLDQRLCARSGAASGVAWLKCYVYGCAAGPLARRFQRDDLCVIAPIVLMKPFTDNLSAVNSIADDDAADGGIWAREAHAFARKLERAFDEANVMLVHQLVEQGSSVGFGVERNHIVNLFAGANKTNRQSKLAGNR